MAAISDSWFHSIKAATRDLIVRCGGVVRSGVVANVSKSEVSRWQSTTDTDLISIPAALALEADCGMPLVTTAMAGLHGRRLTDPDGEALAASGFSTAHCEVVRSFAEAIVAADQARADGVVTPAEAEIVDRRYSEAERHLQEGRRALAGLKLRVVDR
jgi:hypothetical protein